MWGGGVRRRLNIVQELTSGGRRRRQKRVLSPLPHRDIPLFLHLLCEQGGQPVLQSSFFPRQFSLLVTALFGTAYLHWGV